MSASASKIVARPNDGPSRRFSSSFWLGLCGLLGILGLGGVGALLGASVGNGQWVCVLTGGLFGLGAGAGMGAVLLLLVGDSPETTSTAQPCDELWLTDHERWDRLYSQLARRQPLPHPRVTARRRPHSRPPLAR
jgi:hypothetical protein